MRTPEDIHEEVYREHGFTLVDVPKATVAERVAQVEQLIGSPVGSTRGARLRPFRSVDAIPTHWP